MHPPTTDWLMTAVQVTTRVISITADALVFGLTLWRTIYIFKLDTNIRGNYKITEALVYNGNVLSILFFYTIS